MKELILIIGGIYGTLAVIFGAFGAHGFKKDCASRAIEKF